MRSWLQVSLVAAAVLFMTAPATYPEILPRPARGGAVPTTDEPSDRAAVGTLEPPWVYLRSAGARGDGVSDDTLAIQTALTAASTSGRPVFCRSGTYLVTSTLTLGTDFVGSPSMGRAACVIKYVGSGTAVIATANPIRIENIVLDLTQDTNTGTGGLLLPNTCNHCIFSSIAVNGRPNGTVPYLNYGIFMRGGGTQDRFTNVATSFATSAIIAGIGDKRFYQSTLTNLYAHNCGQSAGRACLQITGAVDTVMNSGLGGGGLPGAPTRTAVLVAGSDAEAIDIIATELFANAPDGTAVAITRPAHDVSVVTLIDVRLPVPARLATDVVTPPRVTRIATQESGAGPVGFISVAAPIATFEPARGSGITVDECTCSAVAGTVAFRTDDVAPGGATPFGTISFKRAYPSPPIVILSWNSESAATAGVYVDSTSARSAHLRSSHLNANTRYILSYQVVER